MSTAKTMTKNSFQFGSFNSVDDWGICVIAHDFLMPQKRERKVIIPNRSGSYDYGAKYYDERVLTLECNLERKISKTTLRQIAGILSEKKPIRIYDDPQLYYVGEVYDSSEITVFSQEHERSFTLDFICEPFAYSEVKTVPIKSGVNTINYTGTVETPCTIILKNLGSSATKIQIIAAKKG